MDKDPVPAEISLKELVEKFRDLKKYFILKKWIVLSFAIVGALLGLTYSILKKPLYVANCTFVVEEGNRSGGSGQYSGLAALAGIDMGGIGGSSGMFNGENIFELYKSRVMIEKALLSNVNLNGKSQLLIERFIDFEKLRDNWKDRDDLKNISFNGNPDNFSRAQDSIITAITEIINKKILIVDKPDKKLSIIRVQVQSKDELFSKYFNNTLVETVNNFYLQTKTKKSAQNIEILKHQADSVRSVLNNSIYGVASAIDAAPNANPSLQILKAPSQRKQIDVQASGAIYSEIIKNLELSKMSLLQDTPLIQIIDAPVLPLAVTKTGKLAAAVIGAFLGAFAISFWIIIKKAIATVLN